MGVESVLAEPYYYYGTVGGLGYETGPPTTTRTSR